MSKRRTVPTLSTRRRFIAGGLAAGALAAYPAPTTLRAADEEHDGLTFFRIGTGPTAETLYRLGTAISAGISRPPGSSPCDEGGVCGVPGLIAVAQSRAGSIPNIRDVRDRILESALVHADMAYWAFNGGEPFANGSGVPTLRVIADLIPVAMHIVVRADSGIETLRDLKDKVISLGPRGSGTPRFVDTILRVNGVTRDDIHPIYLQPGPAADHLISGAIDAFFDMGAAPIDAIDELTEETDIRLLPLDETTIMTLRQFYPFLRPTTIRAGGYRNLLVETPTVQLGVNWIVHADMDDGLIENVTRALWQSSTADTFNLNNPGHLFPSVEEGRPSGYLPMHPGAKTYYDSLASGA